MGGEEEEEEEEEKDETVKEGRKIQPISKKRGQAVERRCRVIKCEEVNDVGPGIGRGNGNFCGVSLKIREGRKRREVVKEERERLKGFH